MKKDLVHVVIVFVVIGTTLLSGTFVYQKQVYAEAQEALRIQNEEIAYEKEQERIAFLARLDEEAAKAKVAEEEKARIAEKQEVIKKAEEEKRLEAARIAAIADEAERQAALKAEEAAEAKRQATLLEAQQDAQYLLEQFAEQKARDAKIAAEKEAARLAEKKAARLAAKKKSRRSRAS